MAYLDYTDYVSMGGTLGEAAFDLQEFRARQYIDAMTHGRIRGETTVRDAVKYATFALIGAMADSDHNHGREVASESNDGVSVSYATSGAAGTQARYAQIVRDYLACEVDANGTALLYAGVDA